VAVRLKTSGFINNETLRSSLRIAAAKAKVAREDQRQKQKESGGFVPARVLQLRNLGPRYVSTVLDALHESRITPVDATYYLGSKLATIDWMQSEIARRGGYVDA
jgi:hypothetical protein